MLNVAILMEQAKAETGLDDFGDGWFTGPLTRLVAIRRGCRLQIAPSSGGRLALELRGDKSRQREHRA